MASKAPPAITPKRPLVIPERAALLPPKAVVLPNCPKAPLVSKNGPVILPKVAAKLAPKLAPKVAPLTVSGPPAPLASPSQESLAKRPSVSRQSSSKLVESVLEHGRSTNSIRSPRSGITSASALVSTPAAASIEETSTLHIVDDAEVSSASACEATVGAIPGILARRTPSCASAKSHVSSAPAVAAATAATRKVEEERVAQAVSRTMSGEHCPLEADCRGAVGATPWLQIERRINEIRALASANMHQVSGRSTRGPEKPTASLYGNYNTHYEKECDWQKEASHPLSYGMVQSLRERRAADHGSDRWNFVDGFLRPRRKPFASMSELSRHFRHIAPHDQTELIKLLLACRDLEKVIEEQHSVLDMLDHDLREAREILKLPEHLRDISAKKLLGHPPQSDPFYPTSDIPLFIKGRVSLVPGSRDVRLSIVDGK